jgi:hypothetical protein
LLTLRKPPGLMGFEKLALFTQILRSPYLLP